MRPLDVFKLMVRFHNDETELLDFAPKIPYKEDARTETSTYGRVISTRRSKNERF